MENGSKGKEREGRREAGRSEEPERDKEEGKGHHVL